MGIRTIAQALHRRVFGVPNTARFVRSGHGYRLIVRRADGRRAHMDIAQHQVAARTAGALVRCSGGCGATARLAGADATVITTDGIFRAPVDQDVLRMLARANRPS